jgi:glycine cleavage system H lipoate-binding protein
MKATTFHLTYTTLRIMSGARVENGICRIGVTDYAQKSLHEVVYVDLPKRGRKVTRKESLGTVGSVKAVSDYFAPVGGEIIGVNDTLESKPELINKSPYGEGLGRNDKTLQPRYRDQGTNRQKQVHRVPNIRVVQSKSRKTRRSA